jgi:NTE family protein
MASAETSVTARTSSTDGPQKTKIGLVLQGGGALGAYEAGAVKCLYDRGMECTIVAGASSGAVNAVTLAAAKTYPPDELESMWKGFITPGILVPPPIGPAEHVGAVAVPHMYRPRLDYWSLPTWTYVADNTPLKKTLERLDWEQVRDPDHMRVFVSASDIENGKTVYFSNLHPEKQLPGPEYPAVHLGVEHAMASGSFPGGFPWTMIDGRAYWDGGITDNTPLHPVIDNLTPAEAETMPIYVIDVNTSAGYLPANLLHVVLREFEMLLQNNLQTDTHRAARYAQFIGLLKKVDSILEQKDVVKILDEVRELPSAPSGLADVLSELVEVKNTEDWREAVAYDPVRNVHAFDITKPAGESPGDFTGEAIERRLEDGYRQMCEYLDDPGRRSGDIQPGA